METIGYLAAIFMGTVLGLVGGGGSIMTVPILVYLLKVPGVEATAYSLFVVGVAALVGAVDYFRRGLIDFRIGLIFAIPSLVGVYLMRRIALPMLPMEFNLGPVVVTKDTLVLVVFAGLMIAASFSMIKGNQDLGEVGVKPKVVDKSLIGLVGFIVGVVTGFVGAGGGFLTIPVLVVLAGLSMKSAAGTSLIIIGIKSLFGFIGDLEVMTQIDWHLLFVFTTLSILGIGGGIALSRVIPGNRLKPAFGWFVLIIGSGMLFQQVF